MYGLADATATLSSLAFINTQIGLTFLVSLTKIVLENMPLNSCIINPLTQGMFQQIVDQQWIFGKTRNFTQQQIFQLLLLTELMCSSSLDVHKQTNKQTGLTAIFPEKLGQPGKVRLPT